MQIYKSQYITINFFQEDKFTELTWLAESENMTREEYREEIINFKDNVVELDRIGGITDKRDCQFVVPPDLQEWINKTIMPPLLERGQRKLAVVVSNDIIINLSSEQIMEEETGEKFDTKYFDNIEDAREWLKSFS